MAERMHAIASPASMNGKDSPISVNVIPPAMSLAGMVVTRPSHQALPEAHRKPTEISN